MRTPIIAGNWKMNNTIAAAEKLINELKPLVKDAKVEVVICVPYTAIQKAAELTKGSNIKVGAEYVIIGHSERRQMFGETDETVNMRTAQALKNGLKPIVCVGETLAEREGNKTEEVVKRQTEGAFKGFTAADLDNVIIAYEPVWAIGTGKTATAEQANETIKYIRGVVETAFGKSAADKMRIQYGGSMNPANASSLMAQPDIDGGLIGGASLKAEDFAKVVKY